MSTALVEALELSAKHFSTTGRFGTAGTLKQEATEIGWNLSEPNDTSAALALARDMVEAQGGKWSDESPGSRAQMKKYAQALLDSGWGKVEAKPEQWASWIDVPLGVRYVGINGMSWSKRWYFNKLGSGFEMVRMLDSPDLEGAMLSINSEYGMKHMAPFVRYEGEEK